MQQRTKCWVVVMLFAGLAMTTGCEDPKQRIAILEEENLSLRESLEAVRGETDLVKQERDRCYDDLAASQRNVQSLQDRLASARSTPPAQQQPVQLPGQWQQVPGGAMVAIPGSVLFASGKINLLSNSKAVLDKIASEINGSFADKDVYVFGHTDTDPIQKSGWKDNRQLSAERALAVVRHLQGQGVPAKKLVACACGEYQPVAPNTTAEGKARNRRVEIYAVDPALVVSR